MRAKFVSGLRPKEVNFPRVMCTGLIEILSFSLECLSADRHYYSQRKKQKNEKKTLAYAKENIIIWEYKDRSTCILFRPNPFQDPTTSW